MGSIHSYQTPSGKRYVVRYRKPDHSQAGTRGFKTKRDAEALLATVSVAIDQNAYIDPRDSKITIADLGAEWLRDQSTVLKPSSMHPWSQLGAFTSSIAGASDAWATYGTATFAHGWARWQAREAL